MSKISPKIKSDSLALRIKSSSSRVLISTSYSRYKSLSRDYIMDLLFSDKYSGCVRAHRSCDLVTTDKDCKFISAFYSLRIMSIIMRRISSLQTLYVIFRYIYQISLK